MRTRPATFTTIQAAIDAAGPGNTIEVCRGTYAELLSIDAGRDRLTLRAQTPLDAVIEAPTALANRDGVALIAVRGARDITIERMRLVGPIHTGILVQSDPPEPQTAVPRTTVTLRANRIERYLTSGVRVAGTGAVATIEQNQIVGSDATPASGRAGVEVRAGARATIRDNDIGDNGHADPGQAPSVGIRLTTVRGAQVEGNRVAGNGHGIALTETTDTTLRANRVHDNAAYGIAVFTGSRFNTVEANVLRNADPVPALDPQIGISVTIFPDAATTPIGAAPALEPIDCLDETVGGGTAGTANLWWRNDGLTAVPAGLCGLSETSPAPSTVGVAARP